jgi:MFS family permease
VSVLTLPLLRAYAPLPRLAGRWYLPVALASRLSPAMAPLAVLTFVAAATGSFAAAGLSATASAAGSAAGAPVLGRLADRYGQRAVLLVAVPANAASLAAVTLAAGSLPGLFTLCVLAGFTMPQVSGMSRARWMVLARGRLATPFAFEGTADELSYVVGPALAGIVATAWEPRGAVLVAALLSLLAAGAFALHPTHAVVGAGRRAGRDALGHGDEDGRVLRLVAGPVVGMLAMGVLFAAVQAALTAFAVDRGMPSAGGLLYAVMAVGSTLTTLLMPFVPARIGSGTRMLAAGAAMLAGLALLGLGVRGGLVPVVLAVLVAGLGVGPALVTLNTAVGERVPPGRAASAMGLLAAGVVGGIAVGALLAGRAADASGAGGAVAVAGAAAVGLMVLGGATMRR